MSWQAEILREDPNARPEEGDLAGWARFYAWHWEDGSGETPPWGVGQGDYGGGCLDCTLLELADELDRLNGLLNTPEVEDFARGVVLEAAHQRDRWASDHDAGKNVADWFWLIGYLAQKVLFALLMGDLAKAKHHCISTAAALANWHLRISGGDSSMRPGIEPPAGADA